MHLRKKFGLRKIRRRRIFPYRLLRRRAHATTYSRTYYTACGLLSDTAKADIRYTPSSSPKGIELSAANPPSPFLCKVHCQHPRERKEEEEDEEEEEGPLRGEKCSLGPFSKG